MTTEIRDPEFARFVDEASRSLSLEGVSFGFGLLESILLNDKVRDLLSEAARLVFRDKDVRIVDEFQARIRKIGA